MEALSRLDRFSSYERTADTGHLSPLSSIRRLLRDLGRPDRSFAVVHVAGTHGKGLTASMIAAILESEGERTGLYTSPYVRDVREGIQIGGEWIAEGDLARYAAAVLDAAERYGGRPPLSRFDLMTAVALLAFAESGVGRAVVEAGLGGRWDSTNVTDKCLAVVTPIDYDHTAVLGETLAEIAEHKLGIAGPATPVVVSEQDPALEEAIMQRLDGAARRVARSREIALRPAAAGRYELAWPDGDVRPLALAPRFPAPAHLECLRTALVACEVLAPCTPTAERRASWIRAALAVSLPGRLEYREELVWQRGQTPLGRVVLDGCHSPAAVRACARQLEAWRLDGYTLILGLAGDKLTGHLRQPLAELCRRASEILPTPFDSPRAARPRLLAAFLRQADSGLASRISPVSSLEEALARASTASHRPLVIAGSLYLIRDVLSRDSAQV